MLFKLALFDADLATSQYRPPCHSWGRHLCPLQHWEASSVRSGATSLCFRHTQHLRPPHCFRSSRQATFFQASGIKGGSHCLRGAEQLLLLSFLLSILLLLLPLPCCGCHVPQDRRRSSPRCGPYLLESIISVHDQLHDMPYWHWFVLQRQPCVRLHHWSHVAFYPTMVFASVGASVPLWAFISGSCAHSQAFALPNNLHGCHLPILSHDSSCLLEFSDSAFLSSHRILQCACRDLQIPFRMLLHWRGTSIVVIAR